MTSKFIITIYVVFVGLGMVTPSFAEEKKQVDPKTIPNAEDLIKHCWDISEEKRSSGGTTLMRQGGMDSVMCLEQEIITYGSALISKSVMTKEEIAKIMENIRSSYSRLYWSMHNDNVGCFPRCGTINYLMHVGELGARYEKILRDIMKLNQENEK